MAESRAGSARLLVDEQQEVDQVQHTGAVVQRSSATPLPASWRLTAQSEMKLLKSTAAGESPEVAAAVA